MIVRFFISVCLILAVSKGYSQESTGVVSKIQGFYIFTDSQPIAEYEVVGEVSTEGHDDDDISKSKGQYQPVRDFLIKAARKMNYTADGLLISPVTDGNDKAVIIKFKENSVRNGHSKVNQYQGIYLFVDSEPLTETEYISTVADKGKSKNLQYHALKEKLIEICRKEQPNAEALVLKLVYGGTDSGDVVRFKVKE